MRWFGARGSKQIRENKQPEGLWEETGGMSHQLVFHNTICTPSLGTPIAVSCELNSSARAGYRQNPDLGSSKYLNSTWKVDRFASFFSLLHPWSANGFLNKPFLLVLHPFPDFLPFPQLYAHARANLLLNPVLGFWAVEFGQTLRKITAGSCRNTEIMSCSKTYFPFPGGIQYVSASNICLHLWTPAHRVNSVFKAWLSSSTNHLLSVEPGCFLPEAFIQYKTW